MDIPIDLSIALSFIAFAAGGVVGIALRRKDDAVALADLKPHVIAYAREMAVWDEPRLMEWTPELRARFRYQQETSRQLLASRRIA
jgi:hypothetical protein